MGPHREVRLIMRHKQTDADLLEFKQKFLVDGKHLFDVFDCHKRRLEAKAHRLVTLEVVA